MQAMAASSARVPFLLRRPNGRPQACDPCRIRKVACDHGQPVCRRCIKRNQENECVYIIANTRKPIAGRSLLRRLDSSNLTEESPSAPGPALTSSRYDPPLQIGPSGGLVHIESSIASTRVSPFARSVDRAEIGPPITQDAISSRVSPAVQLSSDRASTPVDPVSGYLGFTSHSSIFEETKSSLSLLQGFQAWLPQPTHGRQKQWMDELPDKLLRSPTREICLVILRGVPAPNIAGIKHCKSPRHLDGWIREAGRRVLSTLHERFGDYLGNCRVDSQLLEIASFLSRNTTKPFLENDPNPDRWIGQFTGDNLRWESIGFLFVFPDLCYNENAGLDSSRFKKEWPEVSRLCLGLCIDLTWRFSSANTLLAQLASRQTILESLHAGDASLSSWRTGAEAVALATFLGMHTESNPPSYQPTLASESRRMLFARIFIVDKVTVLFTGRPPCLGHRYTSTPPPLDLRDEDLMADEETIRRAVESLDERGWNTSGGLYASTIARARFMFALIRDELVEIALGNEKQVVVENLLNLKFRQLETVKEFPQSLSYNPEELGSPDVDIDAVYARLLVQLEHLQNLFLVERLLLRRGELDEGNLLVTSFQLVSLTLLFWIHKDRLVNARNSFEWLVMAYATPGGGILCMELLNPTFKGSHPKNPEITRSSIIRKLSLLIGFLDWIDPSGPNGDLCVTSSAIIQHVLDHVLNATTEDNSWPPHALDDMQLDFNFELFDTFEWLRPGG